MDVRGIEVTNQLRSAIRAKLLELGVRYDEELPDYILVMVVNKKSRQQMHEDLHLFLEDSTTPFVDWLHDQVLKKLQKVTVAKKKAVREFVPTVVVKQEEERKKKKSTSTSDDNLKVKDEPNDEKASQKSTQSKSKNGSESNEQLDGSEKNDESSINTTSVSKSSNINDDEDDTGDEVKDDSSLNEEAKQTKETAAEADDNTSSEWVEKLSERNAENVTNIKRILDKDEDEKLPEKRPKTSEQQKDSTNSQPADSETNTGNAEKRLKSCINKPKITSIVSIKTRLGIATSSSPSSRNKFEAYRERNAEVGDEHARKYDHDDHRKSTDKRPERRLYEPLSRRDQFRSKNSNDEAPKRQATKDEPKIRRTLTLNAEAKSKLVGTVPEATEKSAFPKTKIENHASGTIKDRLGITIKPKINDPVEDRQRYVRKRLGPVKSKFIALGRLGINPRSREKMADGFEANNPAGANQDDDDDDDDDEGKNVGPVKSHIIAVRNNLSGKNVGVDGKKNGGGGGKQDEEEDDEDDAKAIASKVIVTPRPLKPLQPAQKRATQSLLLRAVAEANQSVVRQKNPEPSLLDKKSALKRLKPTTLRTAVNQNLAVRLNPKNRLVMENIQVEVTNPDNTDDAPEPYVPQLSGDADDHMGIVMSLFQRGDDKQKFLVTLNGYNNNGTKDKNFSDDEERLEMEVNEEDQSILTNPRNDSLNHLEESVDCEEIENISKDDNNIENNENHCVDNIAVSDEIPTKRRKLSPIIYTRSPSPEPIKRNSRISPVFSLEKKSSVSVSNTANAATANTAAAATAANDKSGEKCRYWPNCTLGSKCAYFHPAVPCSAFPACKFGDKCAYKHPKCKFGLSCTKLGCIFSHPSQQCKYHPFCTKPGCTYLHPQIAASPAVVPLETSRSKFIWRRRD